jgi:hypothetical protein
MPAYADAVGDVWRTWSLWVELPVPQVDVQAFDLLNQQQDCSARRCNLNTRIVLKTARPLAQNVQLLCVNLLASHGSTLLL